LNLTHLVFFSFFNGASAVAAAALPTMASLAPASTVKLSHVRILREFRNEYVAARIHNLLKEFTA
jgi:hypothetical protein